MAKAGNKWIAQLPPETPVSAVARDVLRNRLLRVWHDLRLAARKAEKDPEHVHRLRVATRRAMSVLDLFPQLLPERRTKQMRKWLVRIRRAAGDARDFDVLLARLSRHRSDQPSGSFGLLFFRISALRKEAQLPLARMYRRLKKRHFKRHAFILAGKVRWRRRAADDLEPSFYDAARTTLQGAVQRFFDAAVFDSGDVPALHAWRIQAKGVRYAMELFAGMFESGFRSRLYAQMVQIQDRLGELNDHAAGLKRFQDWLSDLSEASLAEALHELVEAEKIQLSAAREAFDDWWTTEVVDDLKSEWGSILAPEFPQTWRTCSTFAGP